MKVKFLLLASIVFFNTNYLSAQTKMLSMKAGHVFNISLPDYMDKTVGLNDASVFQFKNVIKDLAGFVIVDTKEELSLAEIKFTNTAEYYDNFMEGFLKDTKDRTIGKSSQKKIGELSFIESEASYYDEEIQNTIVYFVGGVETQKSYYKVLIWATKDNFPKYKSDFQKILYSISD